MKITIQMLKEKDACDDAKHKFLRLFPSGSVTVSRRLCERHARDFDFTWASMNLLPPTAFAEYQKACAPALSEYQKVCDNAWAEYHKVCDEAWAEYLKVLDLAWAEYLKVCALAFYRGTRVKEGKVMK